MPGPFSYLTPDQILILVEAFEIIKEIILKPFNVTIYDQYYCVDIQSPPIIYSFNSQTFSAKVLVCSSKPDGSGPFTYIPYVTAGNFANSTTTPATPTFTAFQFQTAGVVPGAFGDDPTDPQVRWYQTVTVVPNIPTVSTFRHRLCGTPPTNPVASVTQIPATALVVQKDAIVNANGINDPDVILPARYVHRTLNAAGTAIDPTGLDLFLQKPFC